MENYFFEALHNFIFEEAGGGAIRHLANRGYTVKKIAESLSFPIPYEKVREAFTKHLLDCGILLREEPAAGAVQEKTEYVREYDAYGKPSFRRVTVQVQGGAPAKTEVSAGKDVLVEKGTSAGKGVLEETGASMKTGMSEKRMSAKATLVGRGALTTGGVGEKWERMDFEQFIRLYKGGAGTIKLAAETDLADAERNIYISCNFGADRDGKIRSVLDVAQAEYIEGICWTRRTMYHLLDRRMFGIAVKLWEAEGKRGKMTEEKIMTGEMPGEKVTAKKTDEGERIVRKMTVEKETSGSIFIGKVYIRR